MRAVLFSVLILSAIIFVTLVLYFTLHDSSVDAQPAFKLKLNATCKHENYTGTCKRQDSCSSSTTTIKLEPCNDGDSSLVCCPNLTGETLSNTRPKRTPGERAVEMCKSYGKTGYREIPNPAFIGPKFLHVPDCKVEEKLIKGGENAEEFEFPHMVYIGNFVTDGGGEVKWLCSGSLVSPEFILSAAHCPISKEYGFAMFGSTKLENTNEFFEKHVLSISEVHVHPQYNPKTNDNDLALFKLVTRLNSTRTRPICLYDSESSLTSNMQVIATGFGLNQEQESNDVLQKVGLNIVDQGSCAKKYKEIPRELPEFPICAYAEGKDTCQGDSGGPIQVRHSSITCMYTLLGVTSFGINCSLETNLPGVYTKVFPYLEWIEDIVWPAL